MTEVLVEPPPVEPAAKLEIVSRVIDAGSTVYHAFKSLRAADKIEDLQFYENLLHIAEPILEPKPKPPIKGTLEEEIRKPTLPTRPNMPAPPRPGRAGDKQAASHSLLDLMREYGTNDKEKLKQLIRESATPDTIKQGQLSMLPADKPSIGRSPDSPRPRTRRQRRDEVALQDTLASVGQKRKELAGHRGMMGEAARIHVDKTEKLRRSEFKIARRDFLNNTITAEEYRKRRETISSLEVKRHSHVIHKSHKQLDKTTEPALKSLKRKVLGSRFSRSDAGEAVQKQTKKAIDHSNKSIEAQARQEARAKNRKNTAARRASQKAAHKKYKEDLLAATPTDTP